MKVFKMRVLPTTTKSFFVSLELQWNWTRPQI